MQDTLILPASVAQQRFWVSDQITKGDPGLNVAVRFALSGELNVGALHNAINQIISRHEILRANFAMSGSDEAQQVAQIAVSERSIPLPVMDLSHLPETECTTEADRIADEIARGAFDLAAGPLLRAALIQMTPTEHVLLVTLHHIVCDGWSIGVFTDELGPLYRDYCESREPSLAPLPVQYADYTMWQQESATRNGESETYWRNQLENAGACEFPPDIPRNNTGTDRGHIVSRLLPRGLTDSLARLSQKNGATLFMTTFAALSALLKRYIGTDEIIVSSQVAGRDQVEIEPLIGPFVNTVILRVSTEGDPSFTELLARSQQVVSQALIHASVPFDRIVELLRVRREPNRTPLADVSFIHQRDFVHPWEYAGVRMTAIPSRSPGAVYDLNFFMVERAEGWRLSCEYNTEIFRTDTVHNLLAQMETLLTSAAHNPNQRLSRLPLLSPEDEHKLLVEWNRTEAEYPRKSRIHDLLTEAAEKHGTNIAAVCAGDQLDYATLEQKSNQLARYLAARGAVKGQVVGLSLRRSLDMFVAVLAALKTGAAYLPLDPSLPEQRLRFLMDDSGISLLITESGLQTSLAEKVSTVLIDGEQQAIANESNLSFDGGASPEDPAYVLYTSGSTGKPKGVAVPHRAVINLLYGFRELLSAGTKDVLVATTTLSFDIAALELFAPMMTGCSLIIATDAESQDPMKLRTLLSSASPTIFQATPVRFRMLIEAGWRNTPQLKVLCGGEKMTRELADQILMRCKTLWNVYGPTETTVWSSAAKIESDGAPITIGRPIANTSFYILDNHLSPVPLGAPGELFIGGDGVACGYLNRPELTAQRFVPNPFGPGRIYKTGDRARYLPDGRVELLGRDDDQVKIRGFRIELGEVEAALQRCPLVSSAAVIVRSDPAGEAALAAFFVPRNSATEIGQLRAYLAEHLPFYMVPAFFTAMESLPMTPSGKVDRKQLPAATVETVKPSHSLLESAPSLTLQDELETSLIGIWESVLGVTPVRLDHNFFDLGGHSVLAAKMFARIERLVGHALPLATLFKAPTVRELAAVIRANNWNPGWSTLVPIREAGSRRPLFLVHPIGGNVLNFAGFCSHFDADQPVYALQARGLDKREEPHTTIEAMASEYIDKIRSVQPQGPYNLGGFSAGGVVAFEMARQLEQGGEKAAVLAFLDSQIHVARSHAKRSSLPRTLRFNFRYAMRMRLNDFLARKAKNLKMRLAVRMALLRESIGSTNHASFLDAEEAFLLALRRYQPQPYTGRGILFRAKDELAQYPDPNLGWDQVVLGGLEVREVSGDHDTLMQEPHIGELAVRLQDSLRQTEQLGMDTKPRIPAGAHQTWAKSATATA